MNSSSTSWLSRAWPIRWASGIILSASLGSVVAAAPDVYNRNWPQWRGPTGNGVALQGNPPVEWSEQKNVQWKVRIPGNGHATPVIWEDKIFVLSAVPAQESSSKPPSEAPSSPSRGGVTSSADVAFTTYCLDRESGRILWEKVARRTKPHEGHHETNTHSSGSPVTDGEHVFSFFGSRGLYCYDLNGNLIWEKDLGRMRTKNGFGEGASPTVHGNVLIVVWDNEDASLIYAFDKRTGRELWKTSRDEKTSWSTPYVLEFAGKKQVVINATPAVRSYDLDTGQLLWECAGQTANAIPSVVADPTTVYAMSGFRGNTAVAIQLGRSGNLTDTDAIRWKITRGTPYVPSPLLYDGFLYFCQLNNGILTCVNATNGEPYYAQQRLAGVANVYASPVGVHNRIYVVGRDGSAVVLEKSPELKILASNKLDDPIDASPAVVGNDLFLRGHKHLYRIAENPTPNRPSADDSKKTSATKTESSKKVTAAPNAPKPSPGRRGKLSEAFGKSAPADLDDLKAIERHVTALAARISPAVVGIGVGEARGSGVVISKDGLVLCAAHVSDRPGRDARFTFSDGKTVSGKTLGTDHEMDASLLKITDSGDWPHADLGEPDGSRIGDWVLALGHPGGFDPQRSIVVRLGRIIRLAADAIQTDCTLTAGDSGGPLFDMHGRIVGIHSRISSSTADNYHVPIATYFATWDRLAKSETWGGQERPARPPYVGADGADDPDGCRLQRVDDAGPAFKAGLKVGDLVVKLDDQAVKDRDSFLKLVRQAKPGDELRFGIRREDKALSLTVKVEPPRGRRR